MQSAHVAQRVRRLLAPVGTVGTLEARRTAALVAQMARQSLAAGETGRAAYAGERAARCPGSAWTVT